jgi:hypothetical protein
MDRFGLTRVRRSIQLHLRSLYPGSHAVQCAVRSCGAQGMCGSAYCFGNFKLANGYQ